MLSCEYWIRHGLFPQKDAPLGNPRGWLKSTYDCWLNGRNEALQRRDLLGEYDGSGNLIEETVWLNDIPVATLRPSGSTVAIYYVHSDQLNTPRAVTRPADNMLMWTWYLDPFGTDAANENPAGAGTFTYNLRFPGQVFDGRAGLHYNMARYYDPAVGRYVESDHIGLKGGVNIYAYTKNRPTSAVDRTGLCSLNVFTATDYSGDSGGHGPATTRGWILPQDLHCRCNGCGGSWMLSECSASLFIEVRIKQGYQDDLNAYIRRKEQDHVNDLIAGEIAYARQARRQNLP